MAKRIERLLIANRGEIAARIIRTTKRMGIHTITVYSDADKGSLHTRLADECWPLGSNDLAKSYLDIGLLVDIARKAQADAIHPGYGFLAENSKFVAACDEAEILFIGPSAKAMELMGNKIGARAFVKDTGVPLITGLTGTPEDLVSNADPDGYPYLIKAAAGGGGKGMRIARDKKELTESLENTSREAKNYFGDGTVYLERFIEDPRHIEIQILGDKQGNAIHLFERECSVQRRYQKIIEEAPSPTVTPDLRKKMGEAAVRITSAIAYAGAGTIEFLVDNDLNFYFLEMNTRIQVEHPVTEMVTGIDIVEEQIRIAEGNPLRYHQDDIKLKGNAIEFRVYAEDPLKDFMPSPGHVWYYQEPSGSGVRIDSALDKPSEVHGFYDPMISKLAVHAPDRHTAIRKGREALLNYSIHGIRTNIPLLLHFTRLDDFIENRISTRYCDINYPSLQESMVSERTAKGKVAVLASFLASQLQNSCHPINVWEHIGYWRQYMQVPLRIDGNALNARIVKSDDKKLLMELDGALVECSIVNRCKDETQVILDGHNYRSHHSRDKEGHWFLTLDGYQYRIERLDQLVETDFYIPPEHIGGAGGGIVSPMPGKVIQIKVKKGQVIKKGDILLVVEAMKMENNILAPADGKVATVNVKEGDNIDTNKNLVSIETGQNKE